MCAVPVNNGPRQLLLDAQQPQAQGGRKELLDEAFTNLDREAQVVDQYLQRMANGERFAYAPRSGEFHQVDNPLEAWNRDELITSWQARQIKQILYKVFPGFNGDNLKELQNKFWSKFWKPDENNLLQPVSSSMRRFGAKIRRGALLNEQEKAAHRAEKARHRAPAQDVPPAQQEPVGGAPPQAPDAVPVCGADGAPPQAPDGAPAPGADGRAPPQAPGGAPAPDAVPEDVREEDDFVIDPALQEKLESLAQNILNFGKESVELRKAQIRLTKNIVQHEFDLREFAKNLGQTAMELAQAEVGVNELNDMIEELRGTINKGLLTKSNGLLAVLKSRKGALETQILGIRKRFPVLKDTGIGLAAGGIPVGGTSAGMGILVFGTMGIKVSVVIPLSCTIGGVLAGGAVLAGGILLGVMAGQKKRAERLTKELSLINHKITLLEADAKRIKQQAQI